MNREADDLIALAESASYLAEEIFATHRRQMKDAEALMIQLLLSNGGSLPLVDSLWKDARSGAWELHMGDGKLWVEKEGGK